LMKKRCRVGILVSLVALSRGSLASHGAARAEGKVTESWILVDTQAHTLSVFRDGVLLEHFDHVSIGRNGFSLDRTRGDGTTPLGTFRIDRIHRKSRFVLFFGIDFPRPEHARRAYHAGLIDAYDYWRILWAFEKNESPPQDTPLGGQLGIHGLGTGDPRIHGAVDWTQGCVALSNEQVKRLSRWVRLGMRVEVR
jgi:murein L,D-transpeptidase YafK